MSALMRAYEAAYNAGRDRNDARVSFFTLAKQFGLTLEQANDLWRLTVPPFPKQ